MGTAMILCVSHIEPRRRPSEIRFARDFVNFTEQAKDAKEFFVGLF
jgi:hypothetical protein